MAQVQIPILHLLAGDLWAVCLASLSLSFFIYKTGMMTKMPVSQGDGGEFNESLSIPGQSGRPQAVC